MTADATEHPTPHFLLQAALLPMLVTLLALLVWLYLDRLAHYIPEHDFPFDLRSLFIEPPILPPDTIVGIDIQADGTVSIAGVLTEPANNSSLPRLRRHLRIIEGAVNRQGGLLLLVRPDSQVTFQRLLDVLSAITDSGIEFYGIV